MCVCVCVERERERERESKLSMYISMSIYLYGLPFPYMGASGKEPTCQRRRHKRHGFDPWVGKIPWRRGWQPPPVFLPGESHGQRKLVGYSLWGRRESDRAEATWQACMHISTHIYLKIATSADSKYVSTSSWFFGQHKMGSTTYQVSTDPPRSNAKGDRISSLQQ